MNNIMPTISVISAVYNAQSTIRRSIESILNQTYRNFELLLIDDGSTDESGKICDEYAKVDKRIKVVHKTNEGVGATRQLGIDMSQGEYMMHVDPDDWIEPDTLEKMTEAARRSDAKITICDFTLLGTRGNEYKCQKPSQLNSIAMIEDILSGHLLGGVCNKLIHSSLYKIEGSNFRKGINYCEDVLFLADVCKGEAFTISYVSKPLYNYDKSAGTSITGGNFSREKYFTYRAFQKELVRIYPRLTFEQYVFTLTDVAPKAFYHGVLSGREFYKEFRNERKAIKAMNCNKQLKTLILLSSYGLYPIWCLPEIAPIV